MSEETKTPDPERKWCAFCGKWGDHQSGTCPEWAETALSRWLNTWSGNCGAPKSVFIGQFKAMMRELVESSNDLKSLAETIENLNE